MSGKRGIGRLGGRVAGVVVGSLLAMSMAGTASASVVDPPVSRVTAGPTPNPIALGGSVSYNVQAIRLPGGGWDFALNHGYSVTAVSGAAGLTLTSSPCVSVGLLQGYIANLNGIVVQTNVATTPLGDLPITLTVTEWETTGCGGAVRDTAALPTHIVVNPATQTITFPVIANRTYGAAAFDPGATATSGLPVSYAATGSCDVSGGNVTITGIGPCSITASQTGNARWLPATPVTRSFNIAPAVLTVRPNDKTRPYGTDNPTLTVDFHGFVYGQSYEVISGNADVSTTAVLDSAVGDYPITATQGTLSAVNYTFAFEEGTLTVTAAGLTVVANNASKIQGDPNPTLSATVTGFIAGQDESVMTTPPVCTTTALDTSPVGTYPITCTDPVAPSYTVLSNTPGTLSVTAGPLHHIVVSPDEASTTAGAAVAFTAEGFDVNGNSTGDVTPSTAFTVVGGTCTGNSCRAGGLGDHTVTGSIGEASDTAILHVTGAGAPDHVSITPNDVSITAGTTQAFTAVLYDASNNPLADVTGSTTFSIDGGGTCTGANCGAADLGDYNITAVTTLEEGTFRSAATLHVTEQVQGETSPPTGTIGEGPAGGSSLAYLLFIAFAIGSLGVLAATAHRRANLVRR